MRAEGIGKEECALTRRVAKVPLDFHVDITKICFAGSGWLWSSYLAANFESQDTNFGLGVAPTSLGIIYFPNPLTENQATLPKPLFFLLRSLIAYTHSFTNLYANKNASHRLITFI